MLSSKFVCNDDNLAAKGRSHLLLRDLEEEKTVKGLKKIKDKQEAEPIEAGQEIRSLKDEILRLENEMELNNQRLIEENEHRELLSSLYEKGIIDEEGNLVENE